MYLSPGIYTKETDFSFYVKQISTSTVAMVGITEKGPINQATLVTSWEQFVTKFGSYINDGYLAYAAKAFFDNGGQRLYVVRVTHYEDITNKTTLTAFKSYVTLMDWGETPLGTLKVSAINEGTWGDDLSVDIEHGDDDPIFEFNIIVKLAGNTVEILKGLAMDDTKDNFVELAVNGVSKYITVEDWDSTTEPPNDRPVIGSDYPFAGGNDGLSGLDDNDYIGDSSQHLGMYALDGIDAINLLLVPGVATAPVIHGGITYCEGRKDLMLIGDMPIGINPTDAVGFRTGLEPYGHVAFNSSYATLYYPWLVISDPVTGKNKMVPPSGAVVGRYANSDQVANVWSAPAGIKRGRIFNVLSLEYSTSRGERDMLYSEGINVIATFPDSGINIWGQKTLQSQPSALDRVNVRRLMMYVEEAIAESSRFVVFEPNNELTWRSLIRTINPFLQGIKDKGGFYDFRVQCDEETNTDEVINRNEMVARIFVQPTKTAEFIELNFILTEKGASFDEIYNA